VHEAHSNKLIRTQQVQICLSQLCPAAAQSKVLCGPVQVSAAVKVSYILTTSPYFDNLEFDIFDAGSTQCQFITCVTMA